MRRSRRVLGGQKLLDGRWRLNVSIGYFEGHHFSSHASVQLFHAGTFNALLFTFGVPSEINQLFSSRLHRFQRRDSISSGAFQPLAQPVPVVRHQFRPMARPADFHVQRFLVVRCGWLASMAAITVSTVGPWNTCTVDAHAWSMWRSWASPLCNCSNRPCSRERKLRCPKAAGTEFWFHGLRNSFISVAERELLLPRSLVKRLVNHSRGSDVTEGYAADWTVEQLREPAQRVADRIDELAGGDSPPGQGRGAGAHTVT